MPDNKLGKDALRMAGVVGKFSADQVGRLREAPAELIHILRPPPLAVVWGGFQPGGGWVLR